MRTVWRFSQNDILAISPAIIPRLCDILNGKKDEIKGVQIALFSCSNFEICDLQQIAIFKFENRYQFCIVSKSGFYIYRNLGQKCPYFAFAVLNDKLLLEDIAKRNRGHTERIKSMRCIRLRLPGIVRGLILPRNGQKCPCNRSEGVGQYTDI